MKLYVNGTKKAANEMIVKGQSIYGVNYSIFGGEGTYSVTEAPIGTIIAFYKKMSGGSPVAQSWGNWDGKKIV